MKFALDIAAPRRTINKAVASEVLYVTECSPWGKLGYETVSTAFRSVSPVYWSPGMPKPDLKDWHGDWIISFKADLILSRATLGRANKGAINFHPSPPKYRGLGGYWWALHNGDDAFGVTCHHMDEWIDHGEIIKTDSFPIWPRDTVESLKHRAAIHALALLNETLNDIVSGKALLPCGVEWEEHLYTNQELELAQAVHATNRDRHNAHASKPLNTRVALEALEAVTAAAGRDEKPVPMQQVIGAW